MASRERQTCPAGRTRGAQASLTHDDPRNGIAAWPSLEVRGMSDGGAGILRIVEQVAGLCLLIYALRSLRLWLGTLDPLKLARFNQAILFPVALTVLVCGAFVLMFDANGGRHVMAAAIASVAAFGSVLTLKAIVRQNASLPGDGLEQSR